MEGLVVEELPRLFASYLKCTSDAERQALVDAHPLVFPEAIVQALIDARAQITASLKEAQDACRLIDGVATVMDLPANGSELVKVQDGEKKGLLDENAIVDRFADVLAQLLPHVPASSRASEGNDNSNGSGALLLAPSEPDASTRSTTGTCSSSSVTPWYQRAALVFEILSYLPVEDVLTNAENVCRNWYMWLCVPDTSRFFWVGCVQREFPQLLQRLVECEGGALFDSDWRSVALLCAAESAEEGTEGCDEADTAV